MLPFWNALGVPSTKLPLDVSTSVSYVLPPSVLSAVMGLLAMMPRTRAARVALWPIVALLALRAAVGVDMSLGKPGLRIMNAYFATAMFAITARALDLALTKEPLVRRLRPANSAPSIIMDALDLSTNSRGVGWNWSHGLYIPRERRPTNRTAFVLCTFLSAAWYASLFGVLHRAVLSFTGVVSNPEGSTIFDQTLPFATQYLRACIISTLSAFATCFSLLMAYDLSTIPAVLFLGQDPAQWPPAFDAPWRATSLIDFWGRRWHQWLRRVFLFLGGDPLGVFFGRVGTILGALIASAVVHDIFLLVIDPDAEPWRMLVGFGMMGPAMLAERAFYKVTGRKVCGVVGWVWTMAWMVVLGNGMIEGVIKVRGFGSATLIDGVVPVRILVEYLVMAFDRWLHAV